VSGSAGRKQSLMPIIPGKTHCKIGKQDALKIAMKLDQNHYGWALPGKFKMAEVGLPSALTRVLVG
jgi:NAD(P)H-nitrite reductase large subunit